MKFPNMTLKNVPISYPIRKKNHYIKLAAIAFAVLIVIFILISLYIRSVISGIPVPVPSPTGMILANFSEVSRGVLTFNFASQLVEYARIHYTESNATSMNASITVFKSNPILPIYLVDTQSYCEQCFIPSTLFGYLNSSLSSDGLVLNRSSFRLININELSSVPKGAIVIIASGLMPNILLPGETYFEQCPRYTNVTLLSLLSAGDTVLYVGRNLSTSVSCSGQVILTSNQTLSSLGAIADWSAPQNTLGVNGTTNPLYLKNQTFEYTAAPGYGTSSYISILNGTFVVLGNYPSAGWNDSAFLLSSDISKVILSRYWAPVLASGAIPASAPSNSGNFTIFTLNNVLPNIPSSAGIINDSYSLVQVHMSNGHRYLNKEILLKYKFLQNGTLSIPPIVGQSQQVQIESQISDSAARTIIGHIQIYNQNFSVAPQSPIPIGQIGASIIITSTSFLLPSGYYIASLIDQNGVQYSSALTYVQNSTIVPVKEDFKNASFIFSATSNASQVNGVQYQININGAYSENGTASGGVINYYLPKGTALSYGSGSFNVRMLNDSYSIPYSYTNPGIVIPPLYIEFAIAAIVIVVLNKVLVPSSSDLYYIDVPEISHTKMEHVKESAETIISVFNKVNDFYKWRYVPLTAEEIKSGISSNVKYGNSRVFITLRNTHSILNKLVKDGVLVSTDEYFAPKSWISDSGHSIDFLVIYRKIRDFCIANGMMSTEMDTATKWDMVVTRKGTQKYIKIYSENFKIRDIEINKNIRTFVVFLNEDNRLDFMDKLRKSHGKNAEILKLAIKYGNVKLTDSENLDVLSI